MLLVNAGAKLITEYSTMYITTQISTLLLKIAAQTGKPKRVETSPNHFGLSFLGSYSDNNDDLD